MKKIGVIGSGTMGRGIAQVAATADCQVVVYDVHQEALDDSHQKLVKVLNRLVEKGKIDQAKSDQIVANIQHSNQLSDLKESDLVIEAIVENTEIKRSVFQELEQQVSNDCIIASNTSSLSIASLAAACQKPERFIGIHFFNPAPLMKLVEIIPAIQTSKEVASSTFELVKGWGKLTVYAKDTPGFIVNRVARPFYGESLRIYDEGIADFATIDWAMKELGGFRMGPFELMDFIGNDINYTVTETVFKEFFYDGRYKPSFTQKRMSEAGLLGRKTGRGYYDYSEDAVAPEPVKEEKLGEIIFNRVLCMLINEAADALYLNIATKEDIDTAMTKGVNYPKGLLLWADEVGIQHCVDTLDQLYDLYREERYRCSPLLRTMAFNNEQFY